MEDLRRQMILLVKACEDLVNAADDTNVADLKAGARIAMQVLLKWPFGYFLFNSFSIRYSKSFEAMKAVLQNNKENFKSIVGRFCQNTLVEANLLRS